MTRLFLRLSALLLMIAMVAGCGWMKARERNDYLQAKAGRPLTIPEGMDAPQNTSALTIPETAAGTNETDVSESPPSVAMNEEPIVPMSSALSPDVVFGKVESALRATSGLSVSDVQAATRTLKVTTEVTQARRTWWSRISGREKIDRLRATRTVGVLAASGGGSAVAIQDARGNDDKVARRVLTAVRQALR